MPGVSTGIKLSRDGQFIVATGTYKPRVKCFDVNQLSMKFERCFDSEPVKMEILSEDYSKLVFLHCDRFLEFHAAHGRHYRLRIPKFGRDLVYHSPSCDLFVVGHSSDIYRLNLERGQFMEPYQTEASCVNCADVNSEHHLLCVGTQESTVEAWDPRTRERCGILDVALKLQYNKVFPAITAMKFKSGIQLAVGTQSGHVLMYDLRSSKPLLVKDHMNQLPIKRIDFNRQHEVVYSMDASMLKIWDEKNGKQMAYIEATSDLNDFATVPGTGMFFFAQENVKMLAYYIPILGPAPKWCSFLDNLTEEIETETVENIYDDYKFVTRKELEEIGLDHLEGTNLLKGYMHGFFMDHRLYNKAKAAADPFAFERYQKQKVRDQVLATRGSRLQIASKGPKVNKELAYNEKLRTDDRFSQMFDNPDFAIDKSAEEFRLLAPVLQHMAKSKKVVDDSKETERQGGNSESSDDDDDLFYNTKNSDASDSGESDAEAQPWVADVKKEYKKIQQEKAAAADDPEMVEVDRDEFSLKSLQKRRNITASLGSRVSKTSVLDIKRLGGNRQMTFSTKNKQANKQNRKRLEENRKHREERRKVIRPTTGLGFKKAFRK